jgi:hypothetical protein
MTRRSEATLGAPIWIELSTSDLDASHAFYTALLGWETEPSPAENHGYTNFLHDGGRIAGSMIKPAEQPGPDSWFVYLASADCAATVAAAETAGAQVLVPAMDVMDLGKMAFLIAPDQSIVGVWQPESHRGFSHIDEPGAPGWFELHTFAYDEALEFYRNVFGWTTDVMMDTPDFRYSRMVDGDALLAGVMDATPHMSPEFPSHWEIYFEVTDIDAASTKVVELGGQALTPPHDSPFGRLGLFADCTGALFKLMQR